LLFARYEQEIPVCGGEAVVNRAARFVVTVYAPIENLHGIVNHQFAMIDIFAGRDTDGIAFVVLIVSVTARKIISMRRKTPLGILENGIDVVEQKHEKSPPFIYPPILYQKTDSNTN